MNLRCPQQDTKRLLGRDALREEAVVNQPSRRGIIDGVDASKWAEEQQKDGFCQAAWKLCLKKNKTVVVQARADHYLKDKKVLFQEVNRENGMRTYGVVVPATMQYGLIRAAHASAFAGHKGSRITLQRLKERFFLAGHGHSCGGVHDGMQSVS